MRRVFAFLLLAFAWTDPAGAATKSYHVTGRVLHVLAGLGGDHTGALHDLGVSEGATVQVDYTLELSTPGSQDAADQTHYTGAIAELKLQIGSWTASRSDAVVAMQNLVSVSDNASADILYLTAPGDDTNHVMLGDPNLAPELVLSLQFVGSASASNGQALDQNPNKYTTLVGAATGTYGQVYFEFKPGSGGGGSTKDPKAACHTARLNAAAALCQSRFQCLARRAKAPEKDPASAVLNACTAKADGKFLTAFDKAGVGAERKHLACPLSVSGDVARMVIGNLVAFSAVRADAVTPPTPALESSWLGAAASACGAGIKAEGKNSAKPDASKLAVARQKGRDKLGTAAGKAVEKAEKKGVVFDPDPDVPGFVGSVDDAIDGAANALEAH